MWGFFKTFVGGLCTLSQVEKQKSFKIARGNATRRKPRAVFFDAAGTLIRLREPVGQTYSRIADESGIQLLPDAADAAFKKGFRSLAPPDYTDVASAAETIEREWWQRLVLQVLVEECGVRGVTPEADACFEKLFGHYGKGDAWSLYPDTLEALSGCQAAGLKIYVVSNFDRRLHGVLEELGLTAYLDGVIISGETRCRKPDPAIFHAAVSRAGHTASECLHIGDDPRADWEGAAAAGLRVFHLKRPGNGLLDALRETIPKNLTQ